MDEGKGRKGELEKLRKGELEKLRKGEAEKGRKGEAEKGRSCESEEVMLNLFQHLYRIAIQIGIVYSKIDYTSTIRRLND